MDDKGFIFTADAALALVVVIIFVSSVLVYALLPIYQSQDHQHLEMLADSALASMEQNGTLDYAASQYAAGNTTGAQDTLYSSLNRLIPSSEGVAYRINVGSNSVTNDTGTRSHLTSNDVATRATVLSAPQQGWKARAYYRIDEVKFYDLNQTTITTAWNFHNYLAGHFAPWQYTGSGTNIGKLQNHPYWAGSNNPASGSNSPSQTSKTISFNIPSTGTINSAKFLVGCMNDSSSGTEPAYSVNLALNSFNHFVPSSNFTYLYTRSGGNGKVYNYPGNIAPSELNSGVNAFNLRFFNASYYSSGGKYSDMPWFSIIANYTTTYKIPEGVITTTSYFPDIGGVGQPSSSGNCINYSLNTGSITSYTGRSTDWNTLNSSDFDDVFPSYGSSIPFGLTNLGTGGNTYITQASAVATETDLYIPPGNNILDGYVVVNGYGGDDGAMVQVKKDGGQWRTVFTSFGAPYTTSTGGTDGYGNIPGTIALQDTFNISAQYLGTGHNTVRVILYDQAEGGDYDLVGLTNCYAVATYTPLSIGWDTWTFNSFQNRSSQSTKTLTEKENFNITDDAQSALLFQGVGLDTRNVVVTLSNATASNTVYSGAGAYYTDLGVADWNQSTHIITSGVSPNGTPILKKGNYTLTITVTPSLAYESGDYPGSGDPQSYTSYADPEIFSGTRVSVIYPRFLANAWALGFSDTPEGAKAIAKQNLINDLQDAHITNPDPAQFKYEVMYVGGTPTATPVRLELWKQ